MADNTFDNSLNNGAPFPEFLKRGVSAAATPAQAPKGRLNRFGHFLVDVAKSKKTHDFMIGVAASAGTSYAVRAGVFAAAATVGAYAIPTAILAAAAGGAATGSVRYYLDYKKAKEAGTWEGFNFKKCAKKLLASTAISTFGGTMMYAYMHQEEAMKFAKPAIDMLREAGVIDAVTKTVDVVKPYITNSMNWAIPGSTDFIASMSEKFVAGNVKLFSAVTNYDYGAAFNSSVDAVKQTFKGLGDSGKSMIASVTNYDYAATYNSSVEAVKKTFSGWGASIKTALGFAAPEPKIVIAETPALPPITSADILAQTQDTVAVETPAPVAETKPDVTLAAEKGWTGERRSIDPFEPRKVKTSIVYADGTIVSPEEQARIAAEKAAESARLAATFDRVRFEEAFKAFNTLPKATPDIAAYIPELGVYPKSAYELPAIPRSALDFGKIYSMPEVSPEMTAAVETPTAGTTALENVPRPVPRPVTFADRFAKTFEDMDLSRRADRAFEAALNGTDQQKKDLAMNVLNGQGGFKKDPELAASIYKFLLEDTKPAAGEKPSQTHLQVVRDTAYLLFHGKGVAADPEAAKAMLQEIAPNSKVARGMLAEWNGEKAPAVARTAKAAVDSVTVSSVNGGNGGSFLGGKVHCTFIEASNGPAVLDCKGPAALVEKIRTGQISLDMK